jgi:hypothetical protein
VSRGRFAVVVAAGLVAGVLLSIVLVIAVRPDDPEPQVIEVVVPAGTGLLDAADEPLLPSRLEVRVGDTLVIDNQDDRTHEVGPYVVAAGQRLEHRFTEPGEFVGECSIHPSGQVTIVVT